MSRQVLLRLYFVPWSYLSDFPSLLSAQLHLNMRFMSFKLPQIHSKAQPMCVCVWLNGLFAVRVIWVGV